MYLFTLQIVIDEVGKSSESYEDFLENLPNTDCRYAVYDVEYRNSDGCIFNKIVFILWSPNAANTRQKMLYASTRDFFKQSLDGISLEVQVRRGGIRIWLIYGPQCVRIWRTYGADRYVPIPAGDGYGRH